MDSDINEARGQGGFPVDQPLEALKKDHHFVRLLFDRYLNTQNRNVKREAGTRILLLLELHTSVEETVFYPRVHTVDASLIDQCEEEHHEARQVMEQLKGMEPDDPQCDRLFQQLADTVLQHIDKEEQQLFPKVQQAGLDLSAIGLEMQAFEANRVSEQARAAQQPGMRR